jgi:hypothetical protein
LTPYRGTGRKLWRMEIPDCVTRGLGLGLAVLVLITPVALLHANAHTNSVGPIVFLTREGCVNTTTMRTRLDEALDRLGAAKDFAVIDADTLSESDARRGYGTPTVLFDNRDLFGMPEPAPPLPSPT